MYRTRREALLEKVKAQHSGNGVYLPPTFSPPPPLSTFSPKFSRSLLQVRFTNISHQYRIDASFDLSYVSFAELKDVLSLEELCLSIMHTPHGLFLLRDLLTRHPQQILTGMLHQFCR